ncbi:MAG: tRNA pseudouridine(55) synthase TruB, partial [Akkermansia sp.]|nr:tRNA pseudouridine(55) synthase TruB [Akkermansia sp.]
MSDASPSGVLLVDKDPGFTSHNAVALCRRILQTKKVGHCGTLDPMATGMLIVVIGKATKMQDLLMCEDKVYTATMKLGVETNSQDADGEVVAEKPTDGITEDAVRAAFAHFMGEFDQVPPMYSAVKINGVPCYKLARKGKEVERKARHVAVLAPVENAEGTPMEGGGAEGTEGGAAPTEPAPAEAPAEATTAFSGQWEPEYEQPMGEYIPQRPILFKPKNRIRELKRKLVAGPEQRYYKLAEIGVGKLQAAIFLSVLVVLISAASTVMFAMDMVPESRLRLMIFGQCLAMMVSALLGSFQLIEGVTDLFKKGFTLNTMLLVTFIVCCVDAVFCLQQLRVPCCAAFSLEVTMA